MESRNDVVESEGCVPSLSSKSDLLDAVATNHKEKLEGGGRGVLFLLFSQIELIIIQI